jgi:hypothetical protein
MCHFVESKHKYRPYFALFGDEKRVKIGDFWNNFCGLAIFVMKLFPEIVYFLSCFNFILYYWNIRFKIDFWNILNFKIIY